MTNVQINTQTGLIEGCEFKNSPHCDERPNQQDISLLVIHNITLPPGEFNGPYIDQLFMGNLDIAAHPFFEEIKHLKVSPHALICRDGKLIQYVPFNKRAWHAGESEFEGRSNCNDFSIGVELEGTDEQEFTKEQYIVLIDLTNAIRQAYPQINKRKIAGHSDISPGRKTDPGPKFNWGFYLNQLKEE